MPMMNGEDGSSAWPDWTPEVKTVLDSAKKEALELKKKSVGDSPQHYIQHHKEIR